MDAHDQLGRTDKPLLPAWSFIQEATAKDSQTPRKVELPGWFLAANEQVLERQRLKRHAVKAVLIRRHLASEAAAFHRCVRLFKGDFDLTVAPGLLLDFRDTNDAARLLQGAQLARAAASVAEERGDGDVTAQCRAVEATLVDALVNLKGEEHSRVQEMFRAAALAEVRSTRRRRQRRARNRQRVCAPATRRRSLGLSLGRSGQHGSSHSSRRRVHASSSASSDDPGPGEPHPDGRAPRHGGRP